MTDHSNEKMLWSFRSETRKQFVPISGAFELTPRCTLDCAMCYVHLTREQMGNRKEQTTEQWIELIDAAHKEGMLFALLTGGECTLHEGFIPIYKHLKDLGCVVTVNTNGTVLTDEILKTFQESPPRCIQISLYGSSEDKYEQVTKVRCYQKVLSNIIRLKEAGLPIRVAITPSKYLQEDAVEITRICKEKGWKCIVNHALIEAHYDTGRSISGFSMTVEEEIALQKKLHPSSKVLLENAASFKIPELEFDREPLFTSQCAAGKSAFAISWDGKMRPCLADDSIEVNLKEKNFLEAWNELCEKCQHNLQPIECEACEMRKACFDCYITRSDPDNPGHRNQRTCEITLQKIRAGIVKP